MRREFWVWVAVITLVVMANRIMFVVFPNLLLDMKFSATQIGLVFSFASFLLILSRVFIGKISDIKGRKGILSVGLLLQSLSLSVFPFLKDLVMFGLVKGVKEVADTLTTSVQDSMLADMFRKKERGRVMAKLGSLYPLGRALGSLVGFAVVGFVSLAMGFYVASLLVFVAFLVFVFGLKAKLPVKGRLDHTLGFRAYNRSIILLALVGMLISMNFTAAYFPAFFILARGLSITEDVLFLLLLVGNILAWGFAYYSHNWIDKFGRGKTALVMALVFSVFTFLYPFSADMLLFFLVLAVISVTYYTWRIAFKTVMMDASRPGVRGEQIGFVKTFHGIGDVLGPVVGGLLIDAVSLASAFWAAGIFGLLAVVILLGLRRY